MRPVKVSSRVYVLFSVAGMLGLAFLSGCFISGRAAYTPSPTKTPRSPRVAPPLFLCIALHLVHGPRKEVMFTELWDSRHRSPPAWREQVFNRRLGIIAQRCRRGQRWIVDAHGGNTYEKAIGFDGVIVGHPGCGGITSRSYHLGRT